MIHRIIPCIYIELVLITEETKLALQTLQPFDNGVNLLTGSRPVPSLLRCLFWPLRYG